MSLSVSDLVKVDINLSPLAASLRNFGVLMIAGDSSVISGSERFRTYTTIEGVAADFGTTAPEYKAAALYFGQDPQPSTLMIGRWISTASAGENIGGFLTPTQQSLANFSSITNGGMVIVVDGTTKTLTGLNFSGATNLNGVATIIDTALSGGSVNWNGENFTVVSDTTGAGALATGTITFTAAGTAADTVTINGQAITLVASAPSTNQILIGTDATTTAANLQAFLQSSSNALLTPATYSTAAGVTTITYKTIGVAGNAFTLAKSSTAITISGATLTGGKVPSSVGYATVGTGTDVSTLLGLTSTISQALVPGFASETPAQCAAILSSMSPAWYGLMFQASTEPTDSQNLDVSTFIESASIRRIYGVTITNTNVLSSLVSSDLASSMMSAGYLRSFCQYSENAYVVASLFGRAFSVDFTANNSTITLMYKQEPSVAPEDLTEQQAATLIAKRCNVFALYVNDTMLIQQGVMSGKAYIDEIQDLDWFQNDIQTNCFNVLYTSTTKVAQTDAGVNQLTNAIAGACNDAVNNGTIAPGVWNGPPVGQLATGQYLKTGYYIFAQPIALQSQSDRDARIAPPIIVCVKLAGAIQYLVVSVNVNR